MKYTLLFRLEGPMQSWGYRSRFDYRDTVLEPTRSGVIGLICAAMGIARDEDISRFDAIRMGVRVDRKGRVERDFHTAGGDCHYPREYGVIKADGSGIDTVISFRDYLTDASFTVGFESDDKNVLDEITHALHDPAWTLFLGRKAFPLTVPPLRPGDAPMEGTLEEHLCSGKGGKRIMIEKHSGERIQYDWPLSFEDRRFKPRSIHVLYCGGEE